MYVCNFEAVVFCGAVALGYKYPPTSTFTYSYGTKDIRPYSVLH